MSSPICDCGEPMFYVGIDDGGGDYGSSLCDIYRCEVCGSEVERNCVEIDDEEPDPFPDLKIGDPCEVCGTPVQYAETALYHGIYCPKCDSEDIEEANHE